MTTNFEEHWLSAYLDDELSADERAQVEQHLRETPAARELLEDLKRVRGMVAQLPQWSASFKFDTSSIGQADFDNDMAEDVVDEADIDDDETYPPRPAIAVHRSLRGHSDVNRWRNILLLAASGIFVLLGSSYLWQQWNAKSIAFQAPGAKLSTSDSIAPSRAETEADQRGEEATGSLALQHPAEPIDAGMGGIGGGLAEPAAMSSAAMSSAAMSSVARGGDESAQMAPRSEASPKANPDASPDTNMALAQETGVSAAPGSRAPRPGLPDLAQNFEASPPTRPDFNSFELAHPGPVPPNEDPDAAIAMAAPAQANVPMSAMGRSAPPVPATPGGASPALSAQPVDEPASAKLQNLGNTPSYEFLWARSEAWSEQDIQTARADIETFVPPSLRRQLLASPVESRSQENQSVGSEGTSRNATPLITATINTGTLTQWFSQAQSVVPLMALPVAVEGELLPALTAEMPASRGSVILFVVQAEAERLLNISGDQASESSSRFWRVLPFGSAAESGPDPNRKVIVILNQPR